MFLVFSTERQRWLKEFFFNLQAQGLRETKEKQKEP